MTFGFCNEMRSICSKNRMITHLYYKNPWHKFCSLSLVNIRGEIMKKLFCLFALMSLVSCGGKKNKSEYLIQSQEDIFNLAVENGADADFDGITDLDEITFGTDADIADLPKLRIKNLNTSLSHSTGGKLKYTEKGRDKIDLFKSEAQNLAYKEIVMGTKERLSIDLFQHLDRELICLSSESLLELYTFKKGEFTIETDLALNLASNSFVESITGVETKLFNLQRNFLQMENNIELQKMTFSTPHMNSKCLSLGEIDFDYKVGGKNLRLSKIKEKVSKELSHIVVISPFYSSFFSINAKQNSLQEILAKRKMSIQLDKDNYIRSINGFYNEFNNIKEAKAAHRRWFLHSSNNSNMKDHLVGGETYIISYLSKKEIFELQNLRSFKSITLKNNRIKLENIKAEMIIDFKVEGHMNFHPPIKEKSILAGRGVFNPSGVWQHEAKACHYTKDIQYDQAQSAIFNKNLNLSLNLSNNLSKRVVQFQKLGKDFFLKLKVLPEDVVDGSISMSFNFLSTLKPNYIETQSWYDYGETQRNFLKRCYNVPHRNSFVERTLDTPMEPVFNIYMLQ